MDWLDGGPNVCASMFPNVFVVFLNLMSFRGRVDPDAA